MPHPPLWEGWSGENKGRHLYERRHSSHLSLCIAAHGAQGFLGLGQPFQVQELLGSLGRKGSKCLNLPQL